MIRWSDNAQNRLPGQFLEQVWRTLQVSDSHVEMAEALSHLLQLILSLWPTFLSFLPLHRWWLQECFLITPQETHLCIRVCFLGNSSYFCRCQTYSDKADSRMGFWSWMTCHQLVIKRPLADCRWSKESSWHINISAIVKTVTSNELRYYTSTSKCISCVHGSSRREPVIRRTVELGDDCYS